MPCYSPLVGYRSKELTAKNKRKIVFNVKYAMDDSEVTIPCGQCIGCRFEKSRQWALRCVHEASLHEENCFITLTYNPEHLPKSNSLDKSHFQKFMKRLRKNTLVNLFASINAANTAILMLALITMRVSLDTTFMTKHIIKPLKMEINSILLNFSTKSGAKAFAPLANLTSKPQLTALVT